MRQPLPQLHLAVVGSRNFSRLDLVSAALDSFGPCVVVTGGAKGVDQTAGYEAQRRGWTVKLFLPEWHLHGRQAGMLRNVQIVDHSDGVLVFWDGRSRGTKHSLDLARLRKKPLILVQEINSEVVVTAENLECNH